MTKEEIIKEMINIKNKLIKIFKSYKLNGIRYYNYKKLKKEVYDLYRYYLKLYVLYTGNKVLSSDTWSSQNNCYFYALNLPTPIIFPNIYNEMFLDSFYCDLGVISNLEVLEDKDFTLDNFLKYIYSDLDALNIKYYPSTINSELKHDGYKIAIFFDEYNKDYHIIRQNNDGLWSQKYGQMDIISVSDNPLNFLNNPLYNTRRKPKYEYIQTLELVKPTIKR